MKNFHYLIIVLILLGFSCKSNTGDWENLIQKDLSNWLHINGPAKYELKDGVIIGRGY